MRSMKKCAGAAVAFPMNSLRTAIDANLLIAAWSAQSALFEFRLAKQDLCEYRNLD